MQKTGQKRNTIVRVAPFMNVSKKRITMKSLIAS